MMQCSPLTSAFFKCFSIMILKAFVLSNSILWPANSEKIHGYIWINQFVDSDTSPVFQYLLLTWGVPSHEYQNILTPREVNLSLPLNTFWFFKPNINCFFCHVFVPRFGLHVFQKAHSAGLTPLFMLTPKRLRDCIVDCLFTPIA